jgi:hypothetical protein
MKSWFDPPASIGDVTPPPAAEGTRQSIFVKNHVTLTP